MSCTMSCSVTLEPVREEELSCFARDIQEAFAPAIIETYGAVDRSIPSNDEVRDLFYQAGSAAYHLCCEGRRVGGAMLCIDEEAGRGRLELFFVAMGNHDRGLGLASWQAIERAYPDIVVWETITPYFEKRNIHFYVNKCGFHIVEFFHPRHIDSSLPSHAEEAAVPGTDFYFRFEKIIKPQ